MQCAHCGNEISTEHNFCRFCGARLGTNVSVSSDSYGIVKPDLSPAKVTTKFARRRMNRLLLWGLIVIGLGITVLANAQHYEWITWAGISVFLAGVGLAVYGLFSSDEASSSGQSSQATILNSSKTTPLLPSKDAFDPVPSITERTTDLLERKPAQSKTKSDKKAEPPPS